MEAEEIISVLIRISQSDNSLDEYELSYILNVGHHLGIKDHIVESLIKDPFIEELTIPKTEEERMTILYYMLFLMRIDRTVKEEEIDLIHHYGFKLGFSRAMINDFIDLMENYKDDKVPAEQMLGIIKRYQN